MNKTAVLTLAISAGMVAVSNATVIGFGDLGGSNASIPTNLTANALFDGSGYVVSNGTTPNISVEWDSNWDIHTSSWFEDIENKTVGGGNWDDGGEGVRIAQLDLDHHTITFSADPDYALILESFDFGQTAETLGITDWVLTLTNSSAGVVWSQSLTMDNVSIDTSVYTVTPNFTGEPGESYTLVFSRTNETYSSNGRHAIDNLSFLQTPEAGEVEVENGTTTIGFGNLGGDNTTIPSGLGSNAFADGNGYTVTNGGTAKIALAWDSNWDIHTSAWFDSIENQTIGGGNWDNEGEISRIAQLDTGTHWITFSAEADYAVVLESFDFGQTAETTGITDWELSLTNASAGVVWSQSLTMDNASSDTSVYTVTPNFTGEPGESYTLTFSRTNETYSSNGRHAIDNLRFSQIEFSVADTVTDLKISGPGLDGSEMVLSWSCESGKPYGVETNASLTGEWKPYMTNLISDETTLTVTTTISGDQTFYRVTSE